VRAFLFTSDNYSCESPSPTSGAF